MAKLQTEVLLPIAMIVAQDRANAVPPPERFIPHHLFKMHIVSPQLAEIGITAFKDLLAKPEYKRYRTLHLPYPNMTLVDLERTPSPGDSLLRSMVDTTNIHLVPKAPSRVSANENIQEHLEKTFLMRWPPLDKYKLNRGVAQALRRLTVEAS